jgi:hypothetical protein
MADGFQESGVSIWLSNVGDIISNSHLIVTQ